MDEQIFEALVEEFYLESQERIQRIADTLMAWGEAEESERKELLVLLRRELHTVKGNAGMMGLKELQDLSHHLEDRVADLATSDSVRDLLGDLDRVQQELNVACGRVSALEDAAETEVATATSAPGGVRVGFGTLDGLVDLLSEMVIFRNRLGDSLGRAMATLPRGARSGSSWLAVEEAHEVLEKTLDRVQYSVMQLRMVPLENLFLQLKRLVFDEAQRLERKVEFRAHGGETPLDKGLLELASEALGHLVRNAVVHGLEGRDERVAAGKPEAGKLIVTAHTTSEEVWIDVEDDGRGIDSEALRERAAKLGLDSPAGADLPTLLALPGLSTRDEADASAGRGMGMAAVGESIRRGGGQLEVVSTVGEGTRFRLRLPLSAAIIRALLLRVEDDLFVLPAAAVREAVALNVGDRTLLQGAAVVRWRQELIPLVDLGVQFGATPERRDQGQILFIESEGRYRGLVVDAIVGIRDIVVKPLDRMMGAPLGISGCTILGDGRVVLILDAAALSRIVQRGK